MVRALLFSMAFVAGAQAHAAQIVLSPSAVIGNKGTFDQNSFGAENIFDAQTGPIAEEIFFGGAYWLNGPDQGGPADAYITIDLGQVYGLTGFELYNTSNGFIGDRGTGDFSIVGANAVVLDGGNGFTLSGPTVTLTAGTLVAEAPSGPRAAQAFASLSTAGFRYLQFKPTSAASARPISVTTNINYGLNELRVFGGEPGVGGVPEPANWAMLIAGFGLTGAMARRRRALPVVVA